MLQLFALLGAGYETLTPACNTEAEFMNVQFFLRFLGVILRVLRIEVSVYNVYITKQFQTTFARGWGGGVGVISVDCD